MRRWFREIKESILLSGATSLAYISPIFHMCLSHQRATNRGDVTLE